MPASDLRVNQTSQTSFECSNCRTTTRRFWGEIVENAQTQAVYYVTWCKQSSEHYPRFDLLIGSWGDNTSADDRHLVAVEFRVVAGEPSFMVIDAQIDRYRPLASMALRRSDVIGTPDQSRVFDMVDAIWFGDWLIEEMHSDTAKAARNS